MTYTDDVFQFSTTRRQQFSEDPSLPTSVSSEKKSDIVRDPSLELIRSSTSADCGSSPRRSLAVSLEPSTRLDRDKPVGTTSQ